MRLPVPRNGPIIDRLTNAHDMTPEAALLRGFLWLRGKILVPERENYSDFPVNSEKFSENEPVKQNSFGVRKTLYFKQFAEKRRKNYGNLPVWLTEPGRFRKIVLTA